MRNSPRNTRDLPDPRIRQEALEALAKYQDSSISMKRILREMRTESVTDQLFAQETLALGVIRYLNTIDFLIARSLGRKRITGLTIDQRNILRLAIYEVRWLKMKLDPSYSQQLGSSLLRVLDKALNINLDSILTRFERINQLSLEYSHPTFIVETLLEHLEEKETIALLSENNSNRTHYIRFNKLRSNSEDNLQRIMDAGIKLVSDKDIPDVYQIVSGLDLLVSSRYFTNGDILIHDKASILAVEALSPNPEDTVWDSCAAPGMKTQLISEKLQNTGHIVASDIYSDRVRAAKKRSHSLGLLNDSWIQADACKAKIEGATKILIDAPCTSTGMIQGHPSFKWRLNKDTLMSIMSVQNKILDGILNSYKNEPGTEIVYATCSILPHEGESQIDSAMSRHDIQLIDPKIPASSGYTGFKCSQRVRRLFPHKHATSGFFIAKMRIN
ncbi:MAG: hypothetical protein JW779_04410 [Candidatus Thorarchaeota archaeon]|nr:hypothetical protein [Candidatus Thorarchaeota archaeon]